MRASITVLAFAAALSIVGIEHHARACGGTFCDNSGPQALPVDQTGENILFVLDGQSVEAQIQIQYMGNAQRFAWVLPVQAVPTFSVGSEALFDAMLGATVPTYGLNANFLCNGCNSGPFGGGSGGSGGSAGSSAAGGGGEGGGNGGPQVVYAATVGAFDVTVLQGGTADEVESWLVGNQYAPSPDAPPILQQYLDEGYLFVAMKLTNGAGIDQIHPIVLKYPGNKPCVPIRLTRVAAAEDMAIRTFFLAKERAVPTTYKHVVLNTVALDWLTLASNYDAVVGAAIDSPVADGHAFITEYAGKSAVVPTYGVYSPQWEASAFASIDPTLVTMELETQGLMYCYAYGCEYQHPLVQGLLHEYLPVPAGVDEGTFYGCLSCYASQIDTTKWSAAGFAADFDARIVQPGKHAVDVLTTWPYLTRMLTRISPAEMTSDPEFTTRGDLGDVGQTQFATKRQGCFCSDVVLPDGRQITTTNGWPTWPSSMPLAERIEDMSSQGPVVVLVDNSIPIETAVASNQAANPCDPYQQPMCPPVPTCDTPDQCAPYPCYYGYGCTTSCYYDGDCFAGATCQSGHCFFPNGYTSPSAGACASGYLADGVCCDAACTGGCESCDSPGHVGQCRPLAAGQTPVHAGCGADACAGHCDGTSGTCVLPMSGTSCGTPQCSDANAAVAPTCGSDGNCSDVVHLCAPYVCHEGHCPTTCAGSGDCIAEKVCDPSTHTCVDDHSSSGGAGGAPPSSELGAACTHDDECASGHCASGVCCATTCDGPCVSCRGDEKQSGASGTCGPAHAGTDPGDHCPLSTDPCGFDGQCDGFGNCRFASAGASCGATSCSEDSVVALACDGAGKCAAAASGMRCAPFGCRNGACVMVCAADADCAGGASCAKGRCVSPRGAACTHDDDCASGACAAGICCDRACDGPCETCSAPSSTGTCTPRVHGYRPAACGSGPCAGVCDGTSSDCTPRASGTPCSAAVCATSDTVEPARTCDGQGRCVATPMTSCAPGHCVDGQCRDAAASSSPDATAVSDSSGGCAMGRSTSPSSATWLALALAMATRRRRNRPQRQP